MARKRAAVSKKNRPAGKRPAAVAHGRRRKPTAGATELSIVVPTFNECENIPVLVERLRKALPGVSWEMIIVDDDSPDGTADVARALGASDPRIRCLRRVGRRGLSGACLEGMLASNARYAAVIDADLQHDERLLLPMLKKLRADEADIVIGTRYAEGGGADTFSTKRKWVSLLATRLANKVLGLELSDPLSGFFMLRRNAVETFARKLSTQGFKILLDIVSTAGKSLRVAELPYQFRSRHSGASKLDTRIALDYAGLVLAKATSGLLSLRFIFFCMVGIVGIGVHFVTLSIGVALIGLPFQGAQILAIVVAIANNFALNNAITYRDQRLTGVNYLVGLLTFYLISSIGALSNMSVGNWLFGHEQTWWAAGLGGAAMSVVWNYAISSMMVWRGR
jgi:dolichol-phosphate mannosyltransferase